MELGAAAGSIKAWIKAWIHPTLARAHASRHPAPHVIVVRRHDDDQAAEVRAVDLHGNVIKCMRIRQPIGPLSMHGDMLCASHGWGMTCVVDMVTGAASRTWPSITGRKSTRRRPIVCSGMSWPPESTRCSASKQII